MWLKELDYCQRSFNTYVSLHLHVVVISEADSVLCSVVKKGTEAVSKFKCKYRH
jgi:hypothetical protein